MALEDDWAYDFACARTLEEVLAAFNAAGPWQWQARESYWYGDYLNTRPETGLHVRVHEYGLGGVGVSAAGLHDRGFMVLLQIEKDSSATRSEVDRVLRDLLSLVETTAIVEIEPYD